MQAVVHSLQQLMHGGRLDPVPVYVDSPLAADIADVYLAHPDCFDAGARRQMEEDPTRWLTLPLPDAQPLEPPPPQPDILRVGQSDRLLAQ